MRSQEDIYADNLLWKNIETIKDSIGLTDSYLAQELGFDDKKFQFYKHNKLSIPFKSVNNLTYKMGINLSSVMSEKIDFNQLREATKLISRSRLPFKYQKGDGSKSFSIRHILKTAKKHGIYDEVCSFFNLDTMSFEHTLDFPVCVQLASDILQYISHKVHLDEDDFNEMSSYNAFYFKDSQFGLTLSNSRNLPEMYDSFIGVVNDIEYNWNYELQAADHKRVIINAFASERLSNYYKRKDYSSITFSKFRIAMASHLTQYLGFANAKGSILKSVHHGDSYCQFQIDLTDLKPLFS